MEVIPGLSFTAGHEEIAKKLDNSILNKIISRGEI